MTNHTEFPSVEHVFALRSGERAVLNLHAGQDTSIRLVSRSHSGSAGIAAVTPCRFPDGAITHAGNILALVAERAASLNDKAATFADDFRSMAQAALGEAIEALRIKEQARHYLERCVAGAAIEMEVMANHDNQLWLQELRQDLAARIDHPENYPNKRFNGLAEATARCLLLYRDAPDAYANLIAGVAGSDTDMFLDTLGGLATLSRLIHSLADDHDYVYNPRSGAVEQQSAATDREPGLVPTRFLAVVKTAQNAVSAASPSHRPK